MATNNSKFVVRNGLSVGGGASGPIDVIDQNGNWIGAKLPTGATGPNGLSGPAGPQGNDGATGPVGIDGATGEQGVQGVDGATGYTGSIGATGGTGVTGVTELEAPDEDEVPPALVAVTENV